MEIIEKVIKTNSQEKRNMALVAALDSQNSILIELALELKPDVSVGDGRLLKHAISNFDLELLDKILCICEITQNEKIMNEAVQLAASLESPMWFCILTKLIGKGGNKDVALATMIENENCTIDSIIWIIEHGAKAFFATMHIEKHQSVAEAIFKKGYGQSIQFSSEGLEAFCHNICKNNKQSVVKRIIQDCPDLVEKLIETAVTGGYTGTLKLLHEEKAVITISDKLLDKAIQNRHFVVIKYIVENGLHDVTRREIIATTFFGNVKTLFFFIKKDKQQMDLQGQYIDPMRYALGIEAVSGDNRLDNVIALLENGYKCNFATAIKNAAVKGYIKMINTLLQYAEKVSNKDFDEAIQLAIQNGHTKITEYMEAYRRKNPQKFE